MGWSEVGFERVVLLYVGWICFSLRASAMLFLCRFRSCWKVFFLK